MCLCCSSPAVLGLLGHPARLGAPGNIRRWGKASVPHSSALSMSMSIHLSTHPSDTCTASLLNPGSSKIQLLRLEGWQLYVFFFPSRSQGKTIRRDEIKCFLKEWVIRHMQRCLVGMSCKGPAGFGVDYAFRGIKSKSKTTALPEGKPTRVLVHEARSRGPGRNS